MPDMTLRPIGSVPSGSLARLFDEESEMWANRLRWSFAPTRERLEAALAEGALTGYVSLDETGPHAYATYAMDGRHGIVGSFFATERARSQGIEATLVRQILAKLADHRPEVIDCQTLFSSAPELKQPFADYGFESAARRYMTIDRSSWRARRTTPPWSPLATKPVHKLDLRAVARLIFEAHQESRQLDASSSFDTLASCDKVLRQIMVDELCGPFDAFSSRRIEDNGRTIAATLVTWPLHRVAHVSEVATSPDRRRRGLARRCLVEALEGVFGRGETDVVTLSVTSSNDAAIAFYESVGFSTRINYESHVLRGGKW